MERAIVLRVIRSCRDSRSFSMCGIIKITVETLDVSDTEDDIRWVRKIRKLNVVGRGWPCTRTRFALTGFAICRRYAVGRRVWKLQIG